VFKIGSEPVPVVGTHAGYLKVEINGALWSFCQIAQQTYDEHADYFKKSAISLKGQQNHPQRAKRNQTPNNSTDVGIKWLPNEAVRSF
jgi:hypothetical protein